jgi:hypothetical protein
MTTELPKNDCQASIKILIAELAALGRKLDVSVNLTEIECKALACSQRLWANFFSADDEISRTAAAELFISLRDILDNERASFPFAWFTIFHDAFRRGDITSAAWGIAARFIYTGTSGGPSYTGDFAPRFLEGFREVSPEHMMNHAEKVAWDGLPDQVRIYRAAYANSPQEVAQGISWSLTRQYCENHILKRRMSGGSHFYSAPNMGGRRAHLISAMVPREAIFTYVKIHDGSELIVDFERVNPSTIAVVPMLSSDDLLKQILLSGYAGEGGISGIYRTMAGLHGIR